jgi:prepilin-type N-terminal cleavage/methylation domain-containing protein
MKKIFKNQKGFSAIEIIIVLVIVALIALVGYVVYENHHKTIGPVTGKWATYSNVAGNFSVLSPTPSHPPDVLPQTTQSHNGVSFTANGIAFFAGHGQYDVTYATYPSSANVPSRSSYLNSLLQPSKYQKDAHLVSSKSITVNGNQAETYKLTATMESIKTGYGGSLPAAKVFYTGEFIRDGKVLYQVYAAIEGNSGSDQADAQYFVNSFKIGQ